MKRRSPLSSLAAFSKALAHSEVASAADLNKKIASFLSPKMGSIYSSENSIKVGTDDDYNQLTIDSESNLPL